MYIRNMIVTTELRPRRGRRAFSDSEEWAIYGRAVHGEETKESIAVEFGVTCRTIENVIRRRRDALAVKAEGEDGGDRHERR